MGLSIRPIQTALFVGLLEYRKSLLIVFEHGLDYRAVALIQFLRPVCKGQEFFPVFIKSRLTVVVFVAEKPGNRVFVGVYAVLAENTVPRSIKFGEFDEKFGFVAGYIR